MAVAVVPWPLTFDRDAPRFAADYVGFDNFFDAVSELGRRAGASDRDQIQWACRYAGVESESWELVEAFAEPNATFTTFRDQVRRLYPHLQFSFHDLEVLIRRTQTYTNMSQEDFEQYHHSFVTIAAYLKNQQIVSDRECGRRYLEGFPQPVQAYIAHRLGFTKPDIIPANGYDFDDIQATASFVFAAGGSSYQSPSFTPTLLAVSSSDRTSIQDLIQYISTMTQSFAIALQQRPQPSSSNIEPAPRPCVFCSAPDHRIRDCLIAVEYHRQGKVVRNEYGRIVLPDGSPPPRSGPGQNIQEKVDYFWEFQKARSNNHHHPRERVSPHFLEIRNGHGFTTDTLTLDDHRNESDTPTSSPDVQEQIRVLQARIESLKKTPKHPRKPTLCPRPV